MALRRLLSFRSRTSSLRTLSRRLPLAGVFVMELLLLLRHEGVSAFASVGARYRGSMGLLCAYACCVELCRGVTVE